MTALWMTEAFVAAAGGTLQGTPPRELSGVSIDSRTVALGDAFVAIRGERHDGHAFVESALRAGAALALVQAGCTPPGIGPLAVVPDDPLAALERIAAAARARMTGRVVAVTGSVGKTGTKEMLRLAFAACGSTHAPVGSFNNHWGVPLTLARMPSDTAYGIFEIGMNHAGEITPLTRLVRPHVAIITTVEPVHLAYFAGEAEIADAKAEIFDGLEPGGTVVLNRDNKWFERLSVRARERHAHVISFGEHPSADVRLVRISRQANGSVVDVFFYSEPISYELGAPGRHIVQNSLAVLAACKAVGADVGASIGRLAGFRAPKGRGERIALNHPAGEVTLIDESYNANPASMRAALRLLGEAEPVRGGRRIAVLGDMLELGETACQSHRDLASALEEGRADLVFLAGPLMRELWQDLPESRRGAYAEGAAELEPILLATIGPGDVIMMKASLGTRLGPLVEAVKRRFPVASK